MKKSLRYSLIVLISLCLLTSVGYSQELKEQPVQKGSVEKVKPINMKKYQNYVEIGKKEVYNPKVLSIMRKNDIQGLKSFDFSKGLKALDKAIDMNPDGYEAYAYKSQLLLYSGDFGEAKVNARKAISMSPNNLEAHYVLGLLHLNNADNYDKAIEELKKVIEIDPKNADAYYNIGYTYIEKKNFKDALVYLTKAISLDPLYDCAYYKRAQAYVNLQEYNKAINDLNILIKRNPKETDYLFRRAGCYSALNNMPKTLADINKVVKLQPNDVDSYFKRLKIYTIINASKQMIEADIKKIEQLSPKDEGSLLKLMDLYYEYDRSNDSVRVAKEVLKQNSECAGAYYGLARAYIDLKQYTLAYENLTTYTQKTDVYNKSYYANLGYVKLGLAGRENKELIKSAIADLTKSIEQGSNVSSCYLYRGSAKILLGDYKSGYEDIKKYRSMVDTPCVLAIHQMGYAEQMASYNAIKYDANGNFLSWSKLNWFDDIDKYGSIAKIFPNDISAILNLRRDASIVSIKNSINKLLTSKVNLVVVHKMRVRYSKNDVMTFVTTSPYINALGDEGTSAYDTNFLIAEQYKEFLCKCMSNEENVPFLKNTDIDSFYNYVGKIDTNDAIDMIYQVVDLTKALAYHSNDNNNNNINIAKQLYLKAIDYMETNNLGLKSVLSKTIMTESFSNLAEISGQCDNNLDLMINYFDSAVAYGYSRKEANKVITNEYLQKGDDAMDANNENDAIYYYNMAVRYGASKFDVYKQIAFIYMDSRNWFNASEYCSKALAIKKDKKVFYVRGLAKKNMNDYSGALGDFGHALGLDKNYSDAIWERADIYFDRRQYSQAMADYKRYAALNKKSAAAVYNIATCLYNQKQKKAAYPYYAKAKGMYQAQGDESGYNSCVRMMNRINGYYY